jgi:hypothetical protein
MTMTGKNRIMIYGPKNDGTYVVEFRTAMGTEARASRDLAGVKPHMSLHYILPHCAL